MHEMALAGDVVDAVAGAAREAGASRVRAAYLTVGNGRDIIPDLFEGLVRHLARGTLAEGLDVVVTHVPLTVRCRDCGLVYPLNVYDKGTWPCPRCHVRDYDLNSGMEFTIDRIEIV